MEKQTVIQITEKELKRAETRLRMAKLKPNVPAKDIEALERKVAYYWTVKRVLEDG